MVGSVRSLLFALALALLGAVPVHAVQVDEILPDPALEARARAISRDLRCMVCQNQSIDDSEAPLARDLRLLVRERLKAGDTDSQVVDFMVARYGEFVLLKPRMSWHTVILWAAPPMVLVAGLIAIGLAQRRRSAGTGPDVLPGLTESERIKLAEIDLLQEGALRRAARSGLS
jgi:cytochrome c-type biogenesis protein CcmH